MDVNAYHNALNQGFSEREAERIGDDAYENAQFMNRKHQEPDYGAQQAHEYFEELEHENTKPIAFIDENGSIVIVGEDAFNRASFVDSDRAFPDAWKQLVIKEELNDDIKAELKWCVDNGNYGPRTEKLINDLCEYLGV